MSNFSKRSGVIAISRARIDPSNCSRFRGPITGAVTAGCASNQARAISVGFSPSSAQRLSYSLNLLRLPEMRFSRRNSLFRGKGDLLARRFGLNVYSV